MTSRQPKTPLHDTRSKDGRKTGTAIRQFILDSVKDHPTNIGSVTAFKFKISRQAVNKHVQRLVLEGALDAIGRTKNRVYALAALKHWTCEYEIVPGLAEHEIWDHDISPLVEGLAKNVLDIWQFCFTEMFNNAVDHSGGTKIRVYVKRTAASVKMLLSDNGVGIFKKIQSSIGLVDERHALLELSKGKLTTDPTKHSGQGIFFTSRLLDSFHIFSGELVFSHSSGQREDWLNELPDAMSGTTINMMLDNKTQRIDEEVFKEFSSVGGYAFVKTIIPVKLAQYGHEKLVSRSQAKKLLTRIDQFQTVLLDFTGVDSIGQAFADEIFRVFEKSHPTMKIIAVHENEQIAGMINGARSEWLPQQS